jgi:hypothetical protein
MMATRKTKPTSSKPDTAKEESPNTLKIPEEKAKSRERKFAEIGLSPTTLNAITARTFSKGSMGEIDITEAVSVMREKAGKVKAGDTGELEATLTAQAVSLDAIFHEMARRAALNMGEYLQATESYMRLALKAQAQCARTIEVLAAIKNPPVIFAKQANIANGPQQVNNGSSTHAPAHAGENQKEQTKLIEGQGYGTMDTRGAAAAIGVNQELETVGAINRPDNARG